MSGSMSWRRLVARNHLQGGYDGIADDDDGIGSPQWQHMDVERFKGRPRDPYLRHERVNQLAGDCRRFEADQRDDAHLLRYAKRAGVTVEQARMLLDALFEADF